MQMNEINWEEKLDIATLVELGAMNRAPTRCGAGSVHAPQRVGARFIAPPGTSRSDVPVSQLFPNSFVHVH